MIGLLELLAIILLALFAGAGALIARSTVDGPEFVLTAAVRHFPPQRTEWGAAMRAEMTQLTQPVPRWRFALSAALIALFPPVRSGRAPVVAVVLTAVTATAAGVTASWALPGLRVFAIAFVAALGLSVALMLHRHRGRAALPWLPLRAPLLLGVAGCVVTTGYVVAVYPASGPVIPGNDLSTSDTMSVVFGLMLAAYAWLALAAPRVLAGDLRSVRIGSLAAQSVFYGPAWPILALVLAAWHAGQPYPFPTEPPSPAPEAVPYPIPAIFCGDFHLPIRDYPEYARHLRRTATIAPDIRYSPIAMYTTLACLGGPTPVANPQHRLRVAHLPTPLLILNARHDPATAYQWAVNGARQLGHSAVLLTYDGWGHGAYGRTPCTTDAVDLHLITRTPPASGSHCPAADDLATGRLATSAQHTWPSLAGSLWRPDGRASAAPARR